MYRLITVIGGNRASSEEAAFASELGSLLADRGFAVVCGGGSGVMEAVSRGCSESGGVVVGILPGEDASCGNSFLSMAIPTGMGVSRNRIVVLAGEAVCAVGGSNGTLSEIAFALQAGKPVCCFGNWKNIPGVIPVEAPEEVLGFVLENTEGKDAQY